MANKLYREWLAKEKTAEEAQKLALAALNPAKMQKLRAAYEAKHGKLTEELWEKLALELRLGLIERGG